MISEWSSLICWRRFKYLIWFILLEQITVRRHQRRRPAPPNSLRVALRSTTRHWWRCRDNNAPLPSSSPKTTTTRLPMKSFPTPPVGVSIYLSIYVGLRRYPLGVRIATATAAVVTVWFCDESSNYCIHPCVGSLVLLLPLLLIYHTLPWRNMAQTGNLLPPPTVATTTDSIGFSDKESNQILQAKLLLYSSVRCPLLLPPQLLVHCVLLPSLPWRNSLPLSATTKSNFFDILLSSSLYRR